MRTLGPLLLALALAAGCARPAAPTPTTVAETAPSTPAPPPAGATSPTGVAAAPTSAPSVAASPSTVPPTATRAAPAATPTPVLPTVTSRATAPSAPATVPPGTVPSAPATPTAAPAAAPTASSGTATSVDAYITWLKSTVMSVDDASDQLDSLLDESTHDAAWQASVIKALGTWTNAYAAAQAQHPPAGLARGHAAVLDALKSYSLAAGLITQGVAQNDEGAITSGLALEDVGSDALDAALALLDSSLGGAAPITTGAGTAAPAVAAPANLVASATISNATPRPRQLVAVTGRLVDAAGNGVAGAMLHAVWHFRGTTLTCDGGPTGANGSASCSQNIGRSPPGVPVRVDVTLTLNGQSYTASASFTPS